MTTSTDRDLPLRIVVVRPPMGVAFAVQRGRDALLPPTRASAGEIVFDLTVRVADRGGAVNVLGPFAHGTPADRFVYVSSGTSAGQAGSCWTRRAKVKTAAIDWPLVEAALATPGAVLEARIEGTARDGGPCCATVPLLDGGWTMRRD
ncbi:DUF5990 family protein [Longimicrobium sp.]|uniref:DUF5990 family protein n=1 Tax=Longimicrobium sp. TaxID=2029185 RepID=UPI002C3139D2|nr:DUF5990 family protein [Longimicrobium sp.]HSU17469.1 DUF5990 family protein [Longimicrobium sp.]